MDDPRQRHRQSLLGPGAFANCRAEHSWIGLIFCTPFTILPTILGIFEIIYAAKLMSNPPQAVQPSTTLAILEIVCVLAGNLFSVVVGILALVFYNDLTVRDYFARLNGTLAPAAAVLPLVPASTPGLSLLLPYQKKLSLWRSPSSNDRDVFPKAKTAS